MPPIATTGLPRAGTRSRDETQPARAVAGVLGRGSEDGSDGDVGRPRPAAPVDLRLVCVDSPTMASAPATPRAASTGRSSWPTWTPAAPLSAAMSARSLTMSSAPCLRCQPNHPVGERQEVAARFVLHRSCRTRRRRRGRRARGRADRSPAPRRRRVSIRDRGKVPSEAPAPRVRTGYTASARLPAAGFVATRNRSMKPV